MYNVAILHRNICSDLVNSSTLNAALRGCALLVVLMTASAANAEVQATKYNTLRWIKEVCENSLTNHGRKSIADRGKTVAEVCNCTANNMWKKFPSTSYWVQETNPYEWNKITEAFPIVLGECIEK